MRTDTFRVVARSGTRRRVVVVRATSIERALHLFRGSKLHREGFRVREVLAQWGDVPLYVEHSEHSDPAISTDLD